jgi:hypothetical protein
MTVNIRFTASIPALIAAGAIVGFITGVLAYRTAQDMTRLSDQKTVAAAQAVAATSKPAPSVTTDLVHVDQSDALADALRDRGYDVHLMNDEEVDAGRVKKETFSVIVIGREVPQTVAATAIRLTHQYLPWVKYIYLQFQYPEMDRHLVLNAQDGWVSTLGLKPLSDADFSALSDGKLSPEAFRATLQKFRGN